MKTMFDTPKKKAVTAICIALVLLTAAVVVLALIVNSILNGKREAEQTALRDAGLDASRISGMHSELDFEDGRFRYEVSFYCDGIGYEYLILARDGDILARDTDGQLAAEHERPDQRMTDSDAGAEAASQAGRSRIAERGAADSMVSNTGISLDEAKAAALADAGLTEDAVTFTKARLDRDDRVYEIEFYTADAEYDYEILADDGTVRERSKDAHRD